MRREPVEGGGGRGLVSWSVLTVLQRCGVTLLPAVAPGRPQLTKEPLRGGPASWPRGLTGVVLCVLRGDFRTFLPVWGFLREAASSCSGFRAEAWM